MLMGALSLVMLVCCGVGVDVDLMSGAVHAESSHMQISDKSPGAEARIGAAATPRSRRTLSGT